MIRNVTIAIGLGIAIFASAVAAEAPQLDPKEEAAPLSAAEPIEIPPSQQQAPKQSYPPRLAVDPKSCSANTDRKPDRVTWRTVRSSSSGEERVRGRTVPVERECVALLCGDEDGCTIRLGMYNWDTSGRTASRDALMYFNPDNNNWRGSWEDRSGSDHNGIVEHVFYAWACYFTDGRYADWAPKGDGERNFGLLSWREYNAECWLTLVD